METELKDTIIGFLDQSGHHLNVNTARLWSFGKLKRKKNTDKKEKINSFGFYALNGNSVYASKESSKKEDVCEFLHEIRENNGTKKIAIILDNARAHWSRKVRLTAKNLNFILIFLPPYSPDLNPIEFIWKSIKRAISEMSLMCKEDLRTVVESLFYSLSSTISFANSWIIKFLDPIYLSI